MEHQTEKGTVKWWSRTLGYGFIKCDSGQDTFVHHSNLDMERDEDGKKNLIDNLRVAFNLGMREGRPKAINVTVTGY
jgi:CspA family cold shock protein